MASLLALPLLAVLAGCRASAGGGGFSVAQQGAPRVVVTHNTATSSTASDASNAARGELSAVTAGTRAYRWRQPRALRLYVQTNVKLAGFSARHLELVDEAVRAWEASGTVHVVRVTQPYLADIRLLWTDDLPTTNPGVTMLHQGRSGRLSRADIFVDVRPAPWSTGTPDRVLYATIAHELGHAFGLPHDPALGALMHASPVVTSVTATDIDRLTRIAGRE